MENLAGYEAASVHLCTGPLYHAAPLNISLISPLSNGATVVLMDTWTATETLQLIEDHRVTHTHMVPTMFHRLLALDEVTRARHDVTSLRIVVHGAAPCPIPVKQAMIEWFGPVIVRVLRVDGGCGHAGRRGDLAAEAGHRRQALPGRSDHRGRRGRVTGSGR